MAEAHAQPACAQFTATPRIGCDLAEVVPVAESIAVFGHRYLDRVFTPAERRQTADDPQRLAARIAGKEAVIKVLQPSRRDAIGFLDVEILADGRGVPQPRLSPRAQRLAARAGVGPIAVSLSHERDLALGAAVAMCEQGAVAVPVDEPLKGETVSQDTRSADTTVIRDALEKFGRLNRPVAELAETDDLFIAGLTSHATVNVMLAIEDALDLEFPDELLTRSTFEFISSLADAVEKARVA